MTGTILIEVRLVMGVFGTLQKTKTKLYVAAPGSSLRGTAAPRIVPSTCPVSATSTSVFGFVVPSPGLNYPFLSCPLVLCFSFFLVSRSASETLRFYLSRKKFQKARRISDYSTRLQKAVEV